MMKKIAVVVLSGGLDSSTLAYHLDNLGYSLICISFNYGQKHIKELESASIIAKKLNAAHHVVSLDFMRQYLQSSSLVNQNIDNPKEEYQRDNMLVTVVPNRNTMMLSLAWTIACANRAELLAFGPHKGDNYVYADCRPEYFQAMNIALRLGTIDSRKNELELAAPFINMTKTEIIKRGHELKVPFELTWSCYDGGEIHCGACGTCIQRRQAFIEANVTDPTNYRNK